MIADVEFERCPTRFIDAEVEQLVLLVRADSLPSDPMHDPAKLRAAVDCVRAFDAANVRPETNG